MALAAGYSTEVKRRGLSRIPPSYVIRSVAPIRRTDSPVSMRGDGEVCVSPRSTACVTAPTALHAGVNGSCWDQRSRSGSFGSYRSMLKTSRRSWGPISIVAFRRMQSMQRGPSDFCLWCEQRAQLAGSVEQGRPGSWQMCERLVCLVQRAERFTSAYRGFDVQLGSRTLRTLVRSPAA